MEDKKTILIVDDEKPIVDVLKFNLQKDGYDTIEAYDGEEAIEKALTYAPDLIILDLMLPKVDGFNVCQRLRQKLVCPIIMLTAKEEVVDKIIGLEIGADDYMTKPFSVRELEARIKAHLRVHVIDDNVKSQQKSNNKVVLKYKDLTLDPDRYIVTRKGVTIDLTMREFEVMKFLIKDPAQIYTREQILKNVWGYDYYGDARTVDVTIRRIREKLEVGSDEQKYIITKRGIGYYAEED